LLWARAPLPDWQAPQGADVELATAPPCKRSMGLTKYKHMSEDKTVKLLGPTPSGMRGTTSTKGCAADLVGPLEEERMASRNAVSEALTQAQDDGAEPGFQKAAPASMTTVTVAPPKLTAKERQQITLEFRKREPEDGGIAVATGSSESRAFRLVEHALNKHTVRTRSSEAERALRLQLLEDHLVALYPQMHERSLMAFRRPGTSWTAPPSSSAPRHRYRSRTRAR
jgi:hypothetical protein